jgi:hypothetical protein
MRLAALRDPRIASRIARALWIAWAVILWNVVFDHVVVAAGRRYVAAAARAAATPHPVYENMDAWMRPAVTCGLWMATAASSAVAASGFFFLRAAARSRVNR